MNRDVPIVVRWRDSQFKFGTAEPDEDDATDDCIHSSVGWLVSESGSWLVLAQTRNNDGEPAERLRIPTSCVISTRFLHDPRIEED